MIINQNILAILGKFSNRQKKFVKNVMLRGQFPKLLQLNFFSKSPSKKKKSNEQFNRCGAKIYLDEIIKSVNYQINNKSLGNDALTAELYKTLF